MTLRLEDTYTEFMVREAKRVDLLAHPYFDSPRRRAQNLVYAKNSGPRQDMVLFGPRETYQKSRISKTMTTFLEPFSGELWALVLAGLVISSVIMYHLEAEDNPAFRIVQTDVMGKETGGAAEGKKKKLGEASEPSDVSMELLDGLFFSLYLSLTGFTGAGGHSPVTRAGRVYQISWSFVILVVVAGYTANLGECRSHHLSFAVT
jgi:hypothetical protein